MVERLFEFMKKLEKNLVVRTIHGGLIMLIPILLTGAFALALRSLPIPVYSTWIKSFGGGVIYSFFSVVYSATFELLAVYETVFIGMTYSRESSTNKKTDFGNIAVTLVAFFILAGADAESFSFGSLGPKGMFTALVASLFSSALYWWIKGKSSERIRLFSDGTDAPFYNAIHILRPLVGTILTVALFNELIVKLSGVACFYELVIDGANVLFAVNMGDVFRGVFYVLLTSILWFFGIHGSDCLEGVAEKYFIPATAVNQAAVLAGKQPTEMFTKGFFDIFVLMGGCGTAICLLVALLLFGRNKSNQTLTRMAALPMLFNINEVMIFGLPVIFNPIMLVPFLTVPLVSFTISYLAMSMGLVPYVTASVEWTTPILLGGYMATGSIAGSVLQLVNLVVGTAIYAPFVRLLDRQHDFIVDTNYQELVEVLKTSERKGKEVKLTDLENTCGIAAKSLMLDWENAIAKRDFEVYYQPQYNYENECIGVEALLRWSHPSYGYVYPPLAIKLAGEADMLFELETAVLDHVLREADRIETQFGKGIKISVNVTGATIVKAEYYEFLCKEKRQGLLEHVKLCIEVTEQIAVDFDTYAEVVFGKIKELGICFAIDDFSMGQTSLDYLKGNIFAIIKLDGSLVGGILKKGNCYEIISSVSHLADSLGVQVLAEYVETKEQKEKLHEAGCDMYQGYLYSPAVKLAEKK